MLNYIWLGLMVLAVLIGIVTNSLEAVGKAAFERAEFAVMKLALPLAGIMALWLGIMRLAEKAGLIQVMARAMRPVMKWLFPDVPVQHPAMGSMLMNMAANILGLSNAATPLGIRAMKDLETLNPRPGVASNAMCTFLAINTSSIQLIPATAVACWRWRVRVNPFGDCEHGDSRYVFLIRRRHHRREALGKTTWLPLGARATARTVRG
jgi:spore maturation protein A